MPFQQTDSIITKRKLAALGVTPRKRRGQNFLLEPLEATSMIAFAGISAGTPVLEIGPGLGILTAELLRAGADLHLVEVDKNLCENLKSEFTEIPQERIIHSDIRKTNLSEIADFEGRSVSIVGNIPYSISTDVVLWIIENRDYISSASLMFQAEFAERLAADPGTKSYGAITVHRTIYAEARLGSLIDGDAFYPKTKVSSRLLRLDMREEPLVEEELLPVFRNIVRTCFMFRRKTLLNCLKKTDYFKSTERIQKTLYSLEIDPKWRPEMLSVAEFAEIARAVS